MRVKNVSKGQNSRECEINAVVIQLIVVIVKNVRLTIVLILK